MRGFASMSVGRLLSGGLMAGLLLVAAGCGSSSGRVSGKVTYKGTTLHGGTVTYYGPGENAWAKTAHIQDDGSYMIDDVPKGASRISVETQTVKPNTAAKSMAARMTKGANIPPEMAEHSPMAQASQADKYVAIPPKYAKPETSGLTYEVKGGKQEHDIPLD
jgi:hypothetical protein